MYKHYRVGSFQSAPENYPMNVQAFKELQNVSVSSRVLQRNSALIQKYIAYVEHMLFTALTNYPLPRLSHFWFNLGLYNQSDSGFPIRW